MNQISQQKNITFGISSQCFKQALKHPKTKTKGLSVCFHKTNTDEYIASLVKKENKKLTLMGEISYCCQQPYVFPLAALGRSTKEAFQNLSSIIRKKDIFNEKMFIGYYK